ncbi:MAG: nucleotidyl transferase AbiEii/AbiGii toxin family protein [Bacteroidales bacterium]
MIDLKKHKFYLVSVLKDIYSDTTLASHLGFKGGTALMLFYDLPRFSVDLDFNLLDKEHENIVYEKIRKIVHKHGTIHDEAQKHYGPVVVLDYGFKERKLKIEISKRQYNDRYEIKDFLGIKIKTMRVADMFAHKLCALTDRNLVISRDVFDLWFLMHNKYPLNVDIVEKRMGISFDKYMEKTILAVENKPGTSLLEGLGELMDEKMKPFVKNKLKDECITLLKMYQAFPLTE